MSYAGWTNRETWNVFLWIGNTQSLHDAAIARVRRAGGINAAMSEEFVRSLWPAGNWKEGVASDHSRVS